MIHKLSSSVYMYKHVNRKGLSKLYLRIIINRKARKYPLEIFIEPENWDKNATKVIKRQDKHIINRIIINELAKVNDIYLKMREIEDVSFEKFAQLYLLIDNTSISEVVKLHSKTIKKESAKVFTTVQKNLIHLFGDISICKINYSKVVKFHEYITEKDLAHNTIWTRHKALRTIINTAIKHGIYKFPNPYKNFKFTYIQPNRVHLSNDEVNAIEQYYITPGISKRMKTTTEAFLFQCYTGLRFTDLKELKWSEIQTKAIVLEQKKTNDIVYIPLIKAALKIIQSKETVGTKVFEIPTNQKYNKSLKLLADKTGINKNLTSHVARHTFAVISIENKIPIEIISKLLGHRDLKTTKTYAKIMNPVLDEWMKNWE